jgi:tetratricopeptide (TPR) repeat protein
VWDLRTGAERASRAAGGILAAFSPDGKRLAGAGHATTRSEGLEETSSEIQLWDTEGRRLLTLSGPLGAVRGLVFSPDGGRLASWCQDQPTVTIWDVAPEATARLEPAPPRRAGAATLQRLGDTSLRLADLQTARDAYRGAVQLFQELAAADPDNPECRRDLGGAYEKLGQVSRLLNDGPGAREAYARCLEIRQALARAEPGNAGSRRDLAAVHAAFGELYQGLDELDAARNAYRHALEIHEALDREQSSPQARTGLAGACENLGACEQLAQRFTESAEWYQRGVDLLAALEKEGKLASWQARALARMRQRLGESRAAQGAVDSLDFALKQPAEQVPQLLYLRAAVLARRGRHAEAAEAANRLAALKPKDGVSLYNAACGFALCVAASDDKALQARYAERSLALLRQAFAAGYTDVVHIEHDKDLDALRGREDFRAFLDGLRKR